LDLTDHEGKKSAEKISELIGAAVNSEEAEPETNHELKKLLKDSVLYFEVSHPTLTATINNVINTLNNLGI
jgi:transcriptional/translational regulatory protein YebC/TACO1